MISAHDAADRPKRGGPSVSKKSACGGLFRQNTFPLLANIEVLRAGRAQPLYLLTPAGRFALRATAHRTDASLRRLRRGRGNAQGNLAAQGFRIHRTLQGIPQRFPVLLFRIKRVKKFHLICTFHASRVYNTDMASQNLSIYDRCRLKSKSVFGAVDTAYDGLIYRQAQADSLATALRCWSSRLCA